MRQNGLVKNRNKVGTKAQKSRRRQFTTHVFGLSCNLLLLQSPPSVPFQLDFILPASHSRHLCVHFSSNLQPDTGARLDKPGPGILPRFASKLELGRLILKLIH